MQNSAQPDWWMIYLRPCRLSEASELVELSRGVSDDEMKGRAISIAAYVAAELGDRARLNQLLAALTELGEVRQRLNLQWVSRHGAALLAIWMGSSPTRKTLRKEGLKLGASFSASRSKAFTASGTVFDPPRAGTLAEVAGVVKRLIDENPDKKAWLPGFALIAADLGFEEPARRRLNLILRETGFDMPFDAKRSASLSCVAEVAVLLGDRDAAARLYELMLAYSASSKRRKHISRMRWR